MRQVVIQSGTPVLLVVGSDDNPVPTLIQNVDPSVTIYLGEYIGLNPADPNSCAPLAPGQSTVASGTLNVFGVTLPGTVAACNVYAGLMSFFQPIGQLSIAGPQAAVLIYSPVAGPGNLVGSWAAVEFTDQYGNDVPAGLNAAQGSLTSMLIQSALIQGSTLTSPVINNATENNPSVTGGTITETSIVFDTAGGLLLMYATVTTTVSFTTAGHTTWTSPVTGTGLVQVWGGDAGAGGGSSSRGGEGGGAGECAIEPNYPLVAGQVYGVDVGAKGTGGNTGQGGSDAGDSGFDNFAVLAGGGQAGSNFIGGPGGNKSANTKHFKGGNGGGDGTQSTGGCGGGGRAGINGPGGNGQKSTSSSGAAGGTAGSGTGGLAGANGGGAAANGNNGPAAGGGCGAATSATTGRNDYVLSSSATYYGSDASGGNANGQRSTGTMYQGGETASGGSFNGTQKSLGIIQGNPSSDLSGKTIDSVQVRLECLHSWYNSGLNVVFGYNGRTSLPGSWDGSDITGVDQWGQSPDSQPHWFDLTGLGLGSALQSGAARAITLGPGPSFNLNYYGFFYGAGGSANDHPVVRVNWHTGAAPVKAGDGSAGRVSVTYASTQTLIAALSPVAGTDAGNNAYAAGYTGSVQAFQPGTSPTVAEVWHDLPPGINGWGLGTGGWKKYRMLPTGSVELSISLRLIGTKNDGTNIFGPGALPAGYQPANAKRLPCIVTQNALSANWPQTLLFGTDGSIAVNGVNATTVTQLDFHGTVPLI